MFDITVPTQIDPQELEERTEAANAYLTEDERHFVNYALDCLDESKKAHKKIRDLQNECWDAYNNEMNFSAKEEWQAKISINKPFSTVQNAKSVIRKAVVESPDFFTVEKTAGGDPLIADFIGKSLKYWMETGRGDITVAIPDACEMGFAVGMSMEMIPTWNEKGGFRWVLVEPWKVHRDPDALPHDPYSGNYWIHQEWLDLWVLKEFEKKGIYRDVERVENGTTDESEAHKKTRKNQTWERSQYRKSVMVNEFWGVVLDKKGNLLLPDATYTVAGNFVIADPKPTPYPNLRWPGVSFSPLPHILRNPGRGLIEGVLRLWYLINNMLCLHVDDLSWFINGIKQIDLNMLVEAPENGLTPGCELYLKPGAVGDAVKWIQSRDKTGDVLANQQFLRQLWEEGTFIPDIIKGLPGSRSQVTLGELEMQATQAMGVADSIAKDAEQGIKLALWAAQEVITMNWDMKDKPSIADVMGMEIPPLFLASLEEKKNFLRDHAIIKVSGVSQLVKRNDLLDKLKGLKEMAESMVFGRYMEPYNIAKTFSDTLGMGDRNLICTEEEAKQRDVEEKKKQMALALMSNQPGQKSGGQA